MREDTTDLNVPTVPPIPAAMIRSTKDLASEQDVSYTFIFPLEIFFCQVSIVEIFLFGRCFKLFCCREPASSSSEEATWDV